jgi:hypothetical protein
MSQPTISPIHTACKKCVFAEYVDKTQNGCRLNYLDIYKNNQDTELLEVFDEDLEFFVINEKKCIGYRENSWFVKFGLENATIEEKIEKFHQINHLDYYVIINLDAETHDDTRIQKLIVELSNLDIKPQKIIFIRYIKNVEEFSYEFIMDFLNRSNLDSCQWRIQGMEDNKALYEHTLHNITSLNKTPRFVLSIKLGDSYNLNGIVNTANNIVYKKLERFYVIKNIDENCMIFGSAVYRFALLANKENILMSSEKHIVV